MGEQGYQAVSMQAIATRAGASKETLYAWFGDRDGLITALIERNADVSATRLRQILATDPHDHDAAVARLTGYAEALLRLLTSDTSVALNRAAMTSPALARQLLAGGRHRVGPVVEQFFARLHAAGLIGEPDAAQAYRVFYGLVVQDTQIRVLLGEPAPSMREIRRQAARAVRAFFACCSPVVLVAPEPSSAKRQQEAGGLGSADSRSAAGTGPASPSTRETALQTGGDGPRGPI